MLDHYTHIERVSGLTSPMLAARRPPLGGEHIVDLFWRLCSARTSSGFGLNPLSYTEIEAFDRLNRLRLLPSEVEFLKQMDAAYLRAVNVDGDAT